MSDNKKKTILSEEAKKQDKAKEISLDELDKVAGGAIGNVRYTPTTDISDDTKNKI